MATSIPAPMPADWWTKSPLRGTGKNGNFTDKDYSAALQITAEKLKEIRNVCIRLIEEQAEDPDQKIDLRSHWNGRTGSQTKVTMIDDLMSGFPEVFNDTARFSPVPADWYVARRHLVDLYFKTANAFRNRNLPNIKTDADARASSSTPSVVSTADTVTESAPSSQISSQPTATEVDIITFGSKGIFTLNNVIIPINFNGITGDVAAWMIRKSDRHVSEPQYCDDVSLEKLKTVLAQEVMTDEEIIIYGRTSSGERRLLLSDQHLQSSITRWMGIYARAKEAPSNFYTAELASESALSGSRKRGASGKAPISQPAKIQRTTQQETDTSGHLSPELSHSTFTGSSRHVTFDVPQTFDEISITQQQSQLDQPPASSSSSNPPLRLDLASRPSPRPSADQTISPAKPTQTPPVERRRSIPWDGIHVQLVHSTKDMAISAEQMKYDKDKLDRVCSRLDIDMGKRHADYCFDGIGTANWAGKATDIDTETGEIFGDNDDIHGQILQSKAINTKSFEQHTPEEWRKCAEFFQIEPDLDASALYKIPGLLLTYSPYQMFAAWWMTRQSCRNRAINGGFLCDKMGYGKSLEILMHILLNRMLAVAWEEVRDSREKRDGLHLDDGAGEGECCPSDDAKTKKSKWCFPCPCTFGITSYMEPPDGPALIAPPSGLVANWKTEWRKHIDPKNSLFDMKLLVHQTMTRTDAAVMIEEIPNAEEFEKNKHENLLEAVEYEDRTLGGAPNTQNYVVLLSKHNHAKRISNRDSGLAGTVWGIIAVDEFHDCKNANTGLMKWLFEVPVQTSIRFISATPWDKSPKDVQPALQIIQRSWHRRVVKPKTFTIQTLENEGVIAKLTAEEQSTKASLLDSATTTFNTIVRKRQSGCFDPEKNASDKQDQDKVVNLMQKTLSPFMIRRTETTMWGDQPAVPMPRHEHRDIYANFTESAEDQKLKQKLAEFANNAETEAVKTLQEAWDARQAKGERNVNPRPTGISANNWLAHMRVARLYGCFPCLLDLDLSPEELKGEGIQQFYGVSDKVERKSWVYKHLDVIDKAPKLRALRELIGHLAKQTEKYWAEAMPLFTVGPVGAFIVYMWLKYKVREGKTEFFHSNLGKEEKRAMVNRFNGEGLQPDEEPTRFLVGTMRVLGVGWTLTRARRCCMIDPEWLRGHEEQVLGRVHRVKHVQKSPKTFSYRIILGDFLPEKVIVRRQDARGIVSNEVYAKASQADVYNESDEEGIEA